MDNSKPPITVTKADTIWIAILILTMFCCYQIGVAREKIGALEDIVFVHGIYKEIEK